MCGCWQRHLCLEPSATNVPNSSVFPRNLHHSLPLKVAERNRQSEPMWLVLEAWGMNTKAFPSRWATCFASFVSIALVKGKNLPRGHDKFTCSHISHIFRALGLTSSVVSPLPLTLQPFGWNINKQPNTSTMTHIRVNRLNGEVLELTLTEKEANRLMCNRDLKQFLAKADSSGWAFEQKMLQSTSR